MLFRSVRKANGSGRIGLELADADVFVLDPAAGLMGLEEDVAVAETVEIAVFGDGFAVDADGDAGALDGELEEVPGFRRDVGVLGAAYAVKGAGGIDGAFDVVELDFVMGFVAGAFGTEEDAAVGVERGADVALEGEVLEAFLGGEVTEAVGAEDVADGGPLRLSLDRKSTRLNSSH